MQVRRPPARLSVLLLILYGFASTGCNLSSSSSNNNPPSPGQLAASSVNLQFGTIPRSSSKELSETITNSGSTALTVSDMATTGAGFSFSGINPPMTLSPSQSASFKVAFAPQSSGSATGNLVITSNASNPTLTIALSGASTAPGQIGVTPANLNFGNVVVGTSQSHTATISANNGPVTVSSVNLSSSEFSYSGLSLPLTIQVGGSVLFAIAFNPQATGSASGTLTFSGSASNSGIAENLSGTGTTPPQHSVTLNWSASPSSNVAGYNLYRGAVSGGPYTKINSALETGTTAIDNTVASAHTYYYVVTAVNTSSQESAYSNQATAVIPFP